MAVTVVTAGLVREILISLPTALFRAIRRSAARAARVAIVMPQPPVVPGVEAVTVTQAHWLYVFRE
jgi:hypothetical protein